MTEQPVAPRVAHQTDPGLRRLAAITVATSLIVWWPAFTLGVYDEIFFEQLFALWAAATAAFVVAVLLLGRRAQPAVYSLLLPSVWILLTWLIPAETTSLGHDVLFWGGVLVTLAGFPAMVAIVLVMVVPGAESVRGRDTVVAIAAIALVVVLSYIMGTQHRRLLTCDDFKISGNDQPAGCTPKGNPGATNAPNDRTTHRRASASFSRSRAERGSLGRPVARPSPGREQLGRRPSALSV